MEPVKIEGADTELGSPPGLERELGGLFVRFEAIGEHNVYASAWKPTAQELKLLNEGGAVVLRCISVQVPVSMSVELGAERYAH